MKYFMIGNEKNYIGDAPEFDLLMCNNDDFHFDLDGYKEFESRIAYAYYHYIKKNLPRKKKKKLKKSLRKK